MNLNKKILNLNKLCKDKIYDNSIPIYWSVKSILLELEINTEMYLFYANTLKEKLINSLTKNEYEKYQNFNQYKLFENLINITFKINETKKDLMSKLKKKNLTDRFHLQYEDLKELYNKNNLDIIIILRNHLNHLVIDDNKSAVKLYKKIIDLSIKEKWIEVYDINLKKENLTILKTNDEIENFFIKKATSLANKSIKYCVLFNPFNSNSESKRIIGFQLASKIIIVELDILIVKIADIISECLNEENLKIFNFFWVIFQKNNII